MTDVRDALFADGAAPGVPDLFGRLIGSWRIHNRSLDEETGVWSEVDVTWSFARTLDGLGVQDVIVLDDGTVAGTTVRAWDAAIEAWRVAWFGVRGRNFSSFTARPDGDDGIVLEGVGEDGRRLRWQFSGIRPEGFAWDGRIESAGGWVLEQHMDAARLG
jgi:hypothetical protein